MRTPIPFILLVLAMPLCAPGCGTTGNEAAPLRASEPDVRAEPAAQETQAGPTTDSLVSENRRLREQVNALATENRTLAARITELEGGQRQDADKSPATAVPSGELTYDDALAAFRKRDFALAIDGFRGLLRRGIEAGLIDNCHYWMGEAYYAQKNYDLAAREFGTVLEMYGADKTDDARLMLGTCYVAMGKNDAAKRILNELVAQSPKSLAAKRAKVKLAQLK